MLGLLQLGLGLSLTRRVGAGVPVVPAGPLTVLFVGSSTPQKYFDTFTGPSNARVTASANGTTFATLGTTGQGATNLGNSLANALNRDVRFIKTGIGGTTLTQWEAAGSSQRATSVNAALASGGVDLIVCGLGFNDARTDKSVTSQAAHEAKLRSFYSKLRTEIGSANCPVFVIATQKYTEGDATSAEQTVLVRSAELAVTADANNYLFGHTYDLAQVDGIHMSNGEYTKHAARGSAQIVAALNGAAQVRGPKLVSASAVSDTQTDVTIQYVAGSDFTPTSALSGFQLSIDSFTSTLAITGAARQSANTVRLTHASTGTSIVTAGVRYMQTGAPDVSGTIYANTTPPTPPDPTVASLAFQTIAGVVTPPAPVGLNAQFIAANGSALSAYTSESGHTFTQGSGSHLLSDGAVYGAVAPANALSSWVPEDAEYLVSLGIVPTTSIQGNTLVRFRVQDESNYWFAGLNRQSGGAFAWIIGYTVGGTATTFTSSTFTPTLGQEYALSVAVGTGGNMVLSVDGSPVAGLSKPDDRPTLLAKGGVGLRASNANQTATTGARITYLQATG